LADNLQETIQKLIDEGIGDRGRLNHILNSVNMGKILYKSDAKYLERLMSNYSNEDVLYKNFEPEKVDEVKEKINVEEQKSEESKDELKEGLNKAEEKIESMEKKLEEHEKTTASIKRYKSEGITLVLSIVVGIMGIMGVGHIYLGRVRRGIIIIIVGIIIWSGLFVPVIILGMAGELEENSDDPTALIGIFGGFAVAGIGAIVLFIWQILNARKLCKQYNEYFEEHGKPPW